MNENMLEVNGLTKTFGNFTAVDKLTFSVKKGEVFGFLGPNGAGKTTTMRMITNFIPSTAGTVLIDGIKGIDNDLLMRKKIGYLPESTPLYGDMFVDEYIKFVGELRGLRGATLKRQMQKMIEVTGLTEMVKRPVGYLSKGYRQRVGLAQAMIHEPELLILDEPISGLDPNQIVEIRELIKDIGREKTVLYCSHILSEVAQTCNRLLIINQGKVVTRGTPDEVTSQFTGKTTFTMKLVGDSNELSDHFNSLHAVLSVHATNDGSLTTVVIETAEDETYGEVLFDSVVSARWKLRELTHHVTTLEDVFTQLTGGKK